MADNINQGPGQGWNYGDGKWYIQPSVGAYANDLANVPFWQGLLHSCVIFLFILNLLAFRHFLNRRGEEIDFETIRPSHFTVWIKDLKKDFDSAELAEFMQRNGRSGSQEADVYTVNVVYDIGRYVATSRAEAKLKAKQLYIQEYKNWNEDAPRSCCKPVNEEAIERELNEVEKNLHEQEEAFKDGIKKLQIGQAFLTFKHQTDARAVALNWNRSGFSIFFQWLCRCCFSGPVHFNNSYFFAQLAPEPSDIMWENLNVSWVFRLYRRLLTWVIMLLILAGSFVLCLYIKNVQKSWLSTDAQTTTTDYYQFKLFSFLLSLAIVFINQCLGIVARVLTEHEKHQTWTSFYLSVSYKLCIFMIVNTTVLLIVVNVVSLDTRTISYTWWTPDGLVNDVLNLMYVECIIGPLTCIFSPRHLMKRFKRFLLERKARKGLVTITQLEANE